MSIKYKKIITGPLQENCYLAWDSDTSDGIIIDPGEDAFDISNEVKSLNLSIKGIYNTHAHFDHTGAVVTLIDELDIPFAVHEEEKSVVNSLATQGAMFGLPMTFEVPPVDIWLKDNDTVTIGNINGKVLHTPGHTPGGVCFLFENVVFVGDTLFAGSVGRSDLPGGSSNQLIQSIKKKLMPLKGSTIVLSGHGPATTIEKEKKYNPFVNGTGFF